MEKIQHISYRLSGQELKEKLDIEGKILSIVFRYDDILQEEIVRIKVEVE